MDFNKRMKKVKRHSVFELEKEAFLVWCGTIAKGDDNRYYLYFSFWPKNKGHKAWVTHSQIGYASSDSPTGPFKYEGIALSGAGGNEWDRDCVHNPTVIKIDGVYYLYYMGNFGDGEFWSHRNNQRVGVAYSNSPKGPFKRLDKPVIEIDKNGDDSLAVSNPAVAYKNGKVYMIYKAISARDELPRGGPVVCKMAIADSPLGEFKKTPNPIMINPENPWSVEDPCIWYENDRFYSVVKDFQGYFTKTHTASNALFESFDGIDWKPSEIPLAFNLQIEWEDGEIQKLRAMERPQILLDENGKPQVLCCACSDSSDPERMQSFNVQIELTE